ncbi:HAD-IB family hydrolase [Halomonas sp. H10-59]|uniref:HAD-IB family hydrolase n=1 Tax=Halomonas sp. H10-59 TaxID=2950874 RepID=A0AAU7KZH2_9GAMM
MCCDVVSAKPVAFFDFDGTLTTGDTLMPFLKFLVGSPIYYTKLTVNSHYILAYFLKVLRNDVAKRLLLKGYLAGYRLGHLYEKGQKFADEIIPLMLRREGMELVKWHQSQGHDCVLVSASFDIYLKAWARRENLSSVICTNLEEKDGGLVSDTIFGKNCHGNEKSERIANWIKNHNPSKTYAYGDTAGDLPMLRTVDYGFMWNERKQQFVRV